MRCRSPHSRLLALFAALCIVAVAAAPSAMATPACPSASATPAKAGKRTTVYATLCVLNAQRARHGLRPLELNGRLARAARRHARDMNRRNYFSHESLGGGSFLDRIRRTGYLRGAGRWTVGENLAWASGGKAAPRTITQMWMNSPGHRANILSASFREVGIGVAYGAPVRGDVTPAATYATDFGAKR
jgi:uncharacterized protein YkwD